MHLGEICRKINWVEQRLVATEASKSWSLKTSGEFAHAISEETVLVETSSCHNISESIVLGKSNCPKVLEEKLTVFLTMF